MGACTLLSLDVLSHGFVCVLALVQGFSWFTPDFVLVCVVSPTKIPGLCALRERYAELKKELLQHCCNPAWMKNSGLIQWNAVAICEMFQTSC